MKIARTSAGPSSLTISDPSRIFPSMIDGIGILDPQSSCHHPIESSCRVLFNKEFLIGLTPMPRSRVQPEGKPL